MPGSAKSDGRLAATPSNCPGFDWLQQQASSGRSDALEALRVARGRDQAHTISASKTAPAPPLEAQAQVTKQGTVIQKVGEHEIRHTSKGLNVEGNVGDDVLIELIARASERFQGSLAAYGMLTTKFFDLSPPRRPVLVVLTRWRNCGLRPSTRSAMCRTWRY